MNAPRPLIVREVQLALMLGYAEIEPFRRALKRGDVLPPSEIQGRSKIWYVRDLERRYGSEFVAGQQGSEQEVLAAIEGA